MLITMSVQEAPHRKVESECLFKNCALLKTIIDLPAHNAYWSEIIMEVLNILLLPIRPFFYTEGTLFLKIS